MYFYTGPGGATNDSPINSDDDEETVKVRECQIVHDENSHKRWWVITNYILGEGEE